MRRLLIGLAFLATLVPLLPTGVMAQESDCSGMEEYIEQRREIRDSYREAFLDQLTGIPVEWEIPNEEWIDTLFSLSDDQFRILSTLWGVRAEALREIDPPAIAVEVHNSDVLSAQRRSNIYRDIAVMGILAAGLMYPDVATPMPGEQTLDDKLANACPAWDSYLAESAATPVPA